MVTLGHLSGPLGWTWGQLGFPAKAERDLDLPSDARALLCSVTWEFLSERRVGGKAETPPCIHAPLSARAGEQPILAVPAAGKWSWCVAGVVSRARGVRTMESPPDPPPIPQDQSLGFSGFLDAVLREALGLEGAVALRAKRPPEESQPRWPLGSPPRGGRACGERPGL